MKDFMMTFRFYLKQSLSPKNTLYKLKENSKFRKMFILICVVILFCIPSYAVFIGLFTSMFKAFQGINQSLLFVVLGMIISVFLIVFFGMFQFMSFYYFSNDVKILTPLPIKPSHYLVSKLFIIYIWELIFSFFAVLPFFVIYAIFEKVAFINWIVMLLDFCLLPIIPLVIVGILTILLMKFSSFFKNKDAVKMFGYILLVVGLLGFQFTFLSTMTRMPQDPALQTEFLQNILNNSRFFLEKFSNYYPITRFMDDALTGSWIVALFSFLIFVVLDCAFIYLFSWFVQWLFIDSYLKEQNNPTRKMKKSKTSYKGSNVSWGIAKIDFITMLKVPIYALNNLSIVIIFPVILIFYSILMPNVMDKTEIDMIYSLYRDNREIFWIIVTLFLGVFAALNPIASTTFSREGKTNWITRTLPISAKQHIIGRLIPALIIEFLFDLVMVTTIIFMLKSQGLSFSIDILYGVMAVTISLVIAAGLSLVGIYIDLKHPMLIWDNPQQPVKQNMNVLLSLALGILYVSAMFGIYKLLNMFMPMMGILIVFISVNIICTITMYNFLVKHFDQNLIRME